MDLAQYARVLRAHRVLIIGAVVICTSIAAVLAWTREPTYEARTQLFVSAAAAPSEPSPSESYQGGLFSQQRVTSYANIVASPPVAEAVVKRSGIPRSAEQVQSAIRASVPENTVLIDVAVTDRSPRVARDIANAVGVEFPRFVDGFLESLPSKESPVKVSVTSPAALPASPVRPKKPLYLTLGILLGLALGIGAAVLREILDRRIRLEEDATAIAHAPVLGRILDDKLARHRPLVVVDDPNAPQAEAYRTLRTNLGVLFSDQDMRSFVVASAAHSEGKSLVVANLGLALAQAGVSVVLVDADLRRPRLAGLLGLGSPVGLSEVLMGHVPLETALQRHDALPLEVLSSGATPPNPSELLGSEACAEVIGALRDRAEIVILDTPALMAVNDAAVLARLFSAVILVARLGLTRTQQFDAAAQSLRSVGKRAVGVVLTGAPVSHRSQYYDGNRVESTPPRYEGAISEP